MRTRWVWFAVVVSALPGCSDFRDYAEDSLIVARNHHLAKQAWHEARSAYCNHEFSKHFGRGFEEGYFSVANGGSGCPPVLPPRRYWNICFQNPAGYDMVQAWFDGYHEGVIAAERDGVANWTQIPTWCRGDECERRAEQISKQIEKQLGPPKKESSEQEEDEAVKQPEAPPPPPPAPPPPPPPSDEAPMMEEVVPPPGAEPEPPMSDANGTDGLPVLDQGLAPSADTVPVEAPEADASGDSPSTFPALPEQN